MDREKEVTIIPIGALTNIATAIIMEPNIVKESNLVMMGGTITRPRRPFLSQFQEHNIRCDPEAARIVFESGIPITMVGLDVTLKCVLTEEQICEIKNKDLDTTKLLSNMTEIWRYGEALDSLYNPGVEDTSEVGIKVEVDWENKGYDILANVDLTASRPLSGFQLWLRADNNVDYNVLSQTRLQPGKQSWSFTESIPRAQFILPGKTKVKALLVNNVGRIVGRYPVKEVQVEPLNSPSLLIGFYRIWSGNPTRDKETFFRMPQKALVSTSEWIKLEVGLEFMMADQMSLVFELFLTDETEIPRWELGKKVYIVSTTELVADATLELVPFGDEVLKAVSGDADPTIPVSLEEYLGIREQGDRIYVPPGRDYRLGFRLYFDNRQVEERILYYDWLDGMPQTIQVKKTPKL